MDHIVVKQAEAPRCTVGVKSIKPKATPASVMEDSPEVAPLYGAHDCTVGASKLKPTGDVPAS